MAVSRLMWCGGLLQVPTFFGGPASHANVVEGGRNGVFSWSKVSAVVCAHDSAAHHSHALTRHALLAVARPPSQMMANQRSLLAQIVGDQHSAATSTAEHSSASSVLSASRVSHASMHHHAEGASHGSTGTADTADRRPSARVESELQAGESAHDAH